MLWIVCSLQPQNRKYAVEACLSFRCQELSFSFSQQGLFLVEALLGVDQVSLNDINFAVESLDG